MQFSLEEAEVTDNTSSNFTAKVNTRSYCLLSSVILMTLFEFGFLVGFFFIFTSCGLYDTKTGKIFLQYFPSGLFIKTLVHYETPSFRVKVGPFPCNYPGNKFTISVPKGMATHYGKSFEEVMFWGDEEEQN